VINCYKAKSISGEGTIISGFHYTMYTATMESLKGETALIISIQCSFNTGLWLTDVDRKTGYSIGIREAMPYRMLIKG
jgi:hypothetical protein